MKLKIMKRGKAPGECGITTDLFQDVGEIAVETFSKLLINALIHENANNLEECRRSLNTEKGHLIGLKIYRPVSFLSLAYKYFLKIVNRFSDTANSNHQKSREYTSLNQRAHP